MPRYMIKLADNQSMTTDAYQEYIDQRRAQTALVAETEITPTLTERDCRVILELITHFTKTMTVPDEIAMKLLQLQTKIEAALTEARS